MIKYRSIKYRSIKRIISFLSALCMIAAVFPCMAYAAEQDEQSGYALVSFDGGKNVHISGLTPVEGNDVYEIRDGVRVLKLGQNGGGPNYMAIDVEDGLFPPDTTKYFAVTVRYYDEGHGWFGFRYNQTVTETPSWAMTDTRTWKEHTFYIDNITFENKSARNSDIMLAGWLYNMMALTPEAVYIQWIKIEESYPQDPVQLDVTSAHTGNIFGGDDPKTLILNAKNTLEDKAECELSYQVLDYDGKVMSDEKSISFSAAAGETVKNEITADVSRYGLYRLKTRLKTRGKYKGRDIETDTGEVCYDFSVMNKFKDGEEGNRFLKTNSHHGDFDTFGNPRGDTALEASLFKEAGLTGDRDEYRWNNVELSKGSLNVPAMGDIVSPIVDSDMDMLMILCYGNTQYTPGYNTEKIFPDNSLFPGYEERFLDYVDWITKKFKGKVKYYEFWNEPNGIPNFNYLGASPEQYAAMLKKVYPVVKKNDPDAIVVGMSIAIAGVEFTRAALKAGAGDYMDMASFHPYVFNMDFNGDRYKGIIGSVRDVYTECGYPDMPFLLTEVGICAWPESGLWPNDYAAAAQITQMYTITQGESLAEAFYIFQYVNEGVGVHWAEGTQEQRWGLVNHYNERVPYSAHPGAIATAAYNKLIGNAQPVTYKTRLSDSGKRTYAYQFKREKDGKDVLIFWTELGGDNIGLKLGADTAEVYDMFSNSEGTLHADNGVFSVTSSFEPVYLVGDFSELEFTDEVITSNGGRVSAMKGEDLSLQYSDAAGRTLSAETDSDKNVEPTGTGASEPGKTTVNFKIGDEFNQEERVAVKLFDGGKMVYYGLNHVIETERPIKLSASVTQHSAKVTGRDVLTLNVLNATLGYELNGSVTVDFTDIGGTKQSASVIGLKSGDTVQLKYNLPVSHSKSVMELDVRYDFESTGPGTENVLVTPDFNCAYTSTPPPIRGEYSRKDWTGSDWVGAKDAYAASEYSGWSGPEEASMEATMLWDEKNLYLLAEVTDDVFYNPYEGVNSWQGDGIQFGIRNDTDSSKLVEGNNNVLTFTELAIYRGADGSGNLYRNVSQFEDLPVGEAKGDVNIEQIDGKWIYRAAIPWSEILGEIRSVKSGDVMHLGMLLNDNDGQGRSFMRFCEGIAHNKSPEKFSTMTLVGK